VENVSFLKHTLFCQFPLLPKQRVNREECPAVRYLAADALWAIRPDTAALAKVAPKSLDANPKSDKPGANFGSRIANFGILGWSVLLISGFTLTCLTAWLVVKIRRARTFKDLLGKDFQ
jgi:hypothetical protein